MNKKQWLNSLQNKYKLSSNMKLEALVSNENNKIYFGPRQIGKTHILLLEAIYYLKTNQNKNIAFVVSTNSQKRIQFKRFIEYANDLIGDNILTIRRQSFSVELSNDMRISFFHNENDMRGHRLDAVFFDELDFINDELFTRVLSCTAHNRECFLIATQTSIANTDKVSTILRRND